MSDRADQRTSSYSYSRGWRQFSRIILHPGLRLLMKHRWQGKENIPSTGGIILAPNQLSYADWPTIALFSDGYAHRYPVFMIKSPIFEVKVIGPLMYKFGQLRAATADITALLAAIRQETPPAVPWDPAAGGRVPLGRTDGRPGGHLQLVAVA